MAHFQIYKPCHIIHAFHTFYGEFSLIFAYARHIVALYLHFCDVHLFALTPRNLRNQFGIAKLDVSGLQAGAGDCGEEFGSRLDPLVLGLRLESLGGVACEPLVALRAACDVFRRLL